MNKNLRRILEIDPQLESKIEATILSKGFRDFHHFATVALENQLEWEAGNKTVSNRSLKPLESQISHVNKAMSQANGYFDQSLTNDEKMLGIPSERLEVSYLSLPENANEILWGQYYRFLPVKVGVRVILNMCTDLFPKLNDFTEKVTNIALPLRHRLARLDRMNGRSFGELLSASFPTNDERSVRRFLNQYMLYMRTSDMTLLGMMPELKLINVTPGEDGNARIGLTKFGSEFALLQNPALDLDVPESLSGEEINYLLCHMADNLPAETEHMTCTLTAISNGMVTRNELNSILRKYYMKYRKGTEWSDTVVNTMRAGLLSRLNDLRLVYREKHGKYVSYHLTDAGRKYIQSVSERVEVDEVSEQ